jgi:predicted pyridoxine 5'-phosphate oxidase superfamily flavin-nucleotide-binding protein
MRLSEHEKDAILAAVRRFDQAAQVFLFGSRVEDSKKEGTSTCWSYPRKSAEWFLREKGAQHRDCAPVTQDIDNVLAENLASMWAGMRGRST